MDGVFINPFFEPLKKSTLLARGRQVNLHLFASQIKSSEQKIISFDVNKTYQQSFSLFATPPSPLATPNHFFILCFFLHITAFPSIGQRQPDG